MTPSLKLTRTSAKLSQRQEQMGLLISSQRKKETIQSAIVGLICVGLLCAILALISILTKVKEIPVIVSYTPPKIEEEKVERPKDLAKGMKPKPASSSSGMSRVIAAATTADVAMPVPEKVDPSTPFGMDDDFSAGFGAGDGDGDGGGGSSFFGTKRVGKRVCFIVDFSLSMESDVETGGTRIDALKKELTASVKSIGGNMNFNVIFFSHNAWTIETPGPNYADKGWNGLNETPLITWYPANDEQKQRMTSAIDKMPAQGNTGWYAPLKMAFNMIPPPDIVYLLSDGEARDSNVVMDELETINPTGIPIDTFAFELPGTPAYDLKEIAKKTGGNFVLFYEGKRYPGESANKFLDTSFDQ